MTVSSSPGSQLVQCSLTVKSFLLMKVANRCRSSPSVCTLMRVIPFSVPRVKIVDVGNPWLGRSGCCAIYWWWTGQYCSLYKLKCRRVWSKVIWMAHCSNPGFLTASMNSLNRYGLGKIVGSLKSEQKK